MSRVILNEANFRTLVSGGIVTQGDVEIALSDIGFDRMNRILQQVVNDTVEKRNWLGRDKDGES
jgi:hypothetical protein